jgi:FKBP-type peptidyl-prolyl cis-trans isomerase 2
MRTVQQGDRVRIHFIRWFRDGVVSSSGRELPFEIIVGEPHRRLPGVGLSLVGLEKGSRTLITVAPEEAYGLRRPGRLRRLGRSWFSDQTTLSPGTWVRVTGRTGRRRLVRILEVAGTDVLVDTNHPYAGRALLVEIEILEIMPRATLSSPN